MERNLDGKQTKAYSPRKPKRVEMSKAECQKLCASVGLDYLDGYEARVIEHVITDETVDRYGDIVRAKGGEMANFRKNSVIQFAHDYASPPVGKSIKVWYDAAEKNIKSYGLFFDSRVDTSGKSDVVFNFIASGAMPACSIGFQPTEVRRPKTAEERQALGLGEYGVEFLKWDLLEYSPCPVPANPNALQNAVKSMGAGDRETVKANEDAFRHLLPDEWVDDILKSIEETSDPEDEGFVELVAEGSLDVEALKEFTAQVKVLTVAIKELTTVVAEAKAENPTPQPAKEPEEAAGENLYEEAASTIRDSFKIAL